MLNIFEAVIFRMHLDLFLIDLPGVNETISIA
jgi:hypothetical protein